MLDKNSLGNILKRLREEKRNNSIGKDQWTKVAVARRIGVSRPAYYAWENGESLPDVENLKRLVGVFQPDGTDEAALYRAIGRVPPELDNLPSLTSFFIGRKAYLEALDQCFESGKNLVFLFGPLGCGKTQIALAYAVRHYQKKYRAVFCIDAGNETDLLNSFEVIATQLKLPEEHDTDNKHHPYHRAEAVIHWLETHNYWLLLMDNMRNPDMAFRFLPLVLRGDVLVTMRQSITVGYEGFAAINVEGMEPEEGSLLLLSRARILGSEISLDAVTPEVREAARQVVELLYGMPAALDSAGKYIEIANVTLNDYIDILSTETDASDATAKEHFYIDDNFLREVGLDSLGAPDKAIILSYFTERLIRQIGGRLTDQLTETVRKTMLNLTGEGYNAAARVLLETVNPNYKAVIAEARAELKAEAINIAPLISAESHKDTDVQ